MKTSTPNDNTCAPMDSATLTDVLTLRIRHTKETHTVEHVIKERVKLCLVRRLVLSHCPVPSILGAITDSGMMEDVLT